MRPAVANLPEILDFVKKCKRNIYNTLFTQFHQDKNNSCYIIHIILKIYAISDFFLVAPCGIRELGKLQDVGLIYFHMFTIMDIHHNNNNKAFVSETFSHGKWSSTYTHSKSVQQIVKDISHEEFGIIISLAANALLNMNQSANTIQYKEAIEKEVESYTKAKN